MNPEDKTTITDNEVIARFMGYFNWEDSTYGNYDKDWNRLMPVVEAIEELEEPHPSNNPEKGTVWPYQVEILSRSMVQIIDNRTDEAIVTVNENNLTKIQAVYKAVLEFIRWYNTQSKP